MVQADARPRSLAGADYVVLRDGVLDGDAIAAAPALRRVVRIDLAGGQVDESALAARSIPLDLVPSTSLMSVAEHAVMCILALLKRFPAAAQQPAPRRDRRHGVQPSLTTQDHYALQLGRLERFEALRGATVGLVGVGRIGLHAAALLRAFGADVVYTKRTRFSPDRERDLGVRFLPFEDLLAESHVVSLHARFTAETERMMGAAEFARMPSGSFFVNTSRGRLVDEDALGSALESGHLAGAALDVIWLEPLPSQRPLLTTPNLILTPAFRWNPCGGVADDRAREAGHLIARDAEQASAGPHRHDVELPAGQPGRRATSFSEER